MEDEAVKRWEAIGSSVLLCWQVLEQLQGSFGRYFRVKRDRANELEWGIEDGIEHRPSTYS